jgi:hypothetical protein
MMGYPPPHRQQLAELRGRIIPGPDSRIVVPRSLPARQERCSHYLCGEIEAHVEARRSIIDHGALVIGADAIPEDAKQPIVNLRPSGDAIPELHVEPVAPLAVPFVGIVRHAILPGMSDQGSDADRRRDALLRRLLKTPPQSRAETAERVRRAKGKPTRVRGKRASAGKREGAA